MLLRRVIDHVKTQNWTAVALDFVIVVVGVFVGIQISNWNDARATNARSVQLLDRLEEEFRVFEAALSRSSDDLALFETSSINVLNAIREDRAGLGILASSISDNRHRSLGRIFARGADDETTETEPLAAVQGQGGIGGVAWRADLG
jgi:hypothetical protein